MGVFLNWIPPGEDSAIRPPVAASWPAKFMVASIFDLIVQNLATIRTVFDKLPFEKQFQLLHMVIKEITYQKDHAKIKIKFYDLPEIKMPPERPKKGVSGGITSRFDERSYWLPREDSNLSLVYLNDSSLLRGKP